MKNIIIFISNNLLCSLRQPSTLAEGEQPPGEDHQSPDLVSSIKDGIDNVLHGAGDYAFLTDAPVAEYYAKRDCRLTQSSVQSTTRTYAIALPKGEGFEECILDKD